MDINSVLAYNPSAAQTTTSSSSSSGKSNLNMDDFYQILAAQLKYQDPSSATDNVQYMGQMAQFATLEAVNTLAKSLSVMQASQAVGKSVLYSSVDATGNSTILSGKVEAVDLSSDNPTCYINGSWVDMSSITTFYDGTLTPGSGDTGSTSGSDSTAGSATGA